MKAVGVLLAATLFGSVAARGQGMFVFNNRVGTEINARFVLPTDPPGTSSVGSDFQVEFSGGPPGTPQEQLRLTDPSGTIFRGPAGSPTAGYVVAVAPRLPGVGYFEVASVLVRVFDGPAWDAASYRFERQYEVRFSTPLGLPPYLPLGTSPLVLQPIPEPSSLLLALLGLGAVVWCLRRKAGVVLPVAMLMLASAGLFSVKADPVGVPGPVRELDQQIIGLLVQRSTLVMIGEVVERNPANSRYGMALSPDFPTKMKIMAVLRGQGEPGQTIKVGMARELTFQFKEKERYLFFLKPHPQKGQTAPDPLMGWEWQVISDCFGVQPATGALEKMVRESSRIRQSQP